MSVSPLYTRVLSATLLYVLASSATLATAEVAAPTYTLQDIVAFALERHPALAEAQAVLSQRQGERTQAHAYPNPTVTGQTGGASVRDPDTGQSRTELIVTFSQPLQWHGKRAADQRAAEASVGGARIGIEEARLNVQAEAKTAFYALLVAQREVDIARKHVAIAEGVARVARARVAAGEAAQVEALKAAVEVLTAKQLLARSMQAVRAGQVRLNTLTSGAVGRAFRVEGEFPAMQPGLELEALSTRALKLHPTIQRLERQVARADNMLAKERHSRVPDVTLFGGYAREIGREAVIGGLHFPAPLWSQRQGEIAAALGAKRQEEAALFRARNEVVWLVSQHYYDAQSAADQIAVFDKGLLKQAEETLRVAQISFRHGSGSLLEVLDAQRVLHQVQLEYVRVQLGLASALTRLERSVGGIL